MIDRIRELLSPQTRRVIGEEAKQALQNKHWTEALAAMDEYLTAQELACDPDNKDKAARIVISRQLLVGIKREDQFSAGVVQCIVEIARLAVFMGGAADIAN